MFKFNIKIVCNSSDYNDVKSLDEESVYGLLQLKVNSKEYGLFFDEINEPRENWFNDDLNYWLESYLDVLIALSKGNYVAINDLESEKTWIEFKKNEDVVTISVVEVEDDLSQFFVVTEPFNNFKYSDWADEQVDFNEMVNEIKDKVSEFLKDVINIDPRFEESKTYKPIKEKYLSLL